MKSCDMSEVVQRSPIKSVCHNKIIAAHLTDDMPGGEFVQTGSEGHGGTPAYGLTLTMNANG
jgi:hypothetical protein